MEHQKKYLTLNDIEAYKTSRGSLKECFDWNEKSKVRQLINKEEYAYIWRTG